MRKLVQFSILVTLLLSVPGLMAQTTIKGTVSDNLETLIGASIYIQGSTSGTQTNLQGDFEFVSDLTGEQTVVISFVGYQDYTTILNFNGTLIDLGNIVLKSAAIGMEEVTIIASIGRDRETPVAMSTVSIEKMELTNGGNELVEALNTTPAVYATKGGGGFGDSRINIRGFDQRNIAVLINGVPVNDMENGQVYWSNWSGLGDAVQTMQVQRGLGASKLAINSVGGTMNIITKTTEVEKGGVFEVSATDYGKQKVLLGLNSGNLEGGWSFSFVGSKTSGQSYVDGTYIDAYSYFASVSKEINEKHMLQFSIIGAPQIHGQRANSQFSASSFDEREYYGRKYNPNWGYAEGEFLNERNNSYHKPQATLNWYYSINEKTYLSTAAYFSVGQGGGTGIQGKGALGYNPGFNARGQYEWDNAIDVNDTSTTGSYQILRKDFNNHIWTGVLSTLKRDLSNRLKLIAGLDVRYYKGSHYREVHDLLGGTHWVDPINGNAQVGDNISYNNDATVFYSGLFGQLEYATEKISSYVAASLSNTSYGREDYYNYELGTSDLKADGTNQIGYNAKAGINYNINNHHNVFASAGIYSRAPFLEFVYLNYSNEINPNIKNEKILAFEAGYGYVNGKMSVKVNGYYTEWVDRWSKTTVTDPITNQRGTAYFQGLDELHVGGELELAYQINDKVDVGVFGSLGDWYYTQDAEATLFDDEQNPISEDLIYSKDLKVGNSPQQQVGAKLNWNIWKAVTLGGSYTRNEGLYAQFDPTSRKDPNDRAQSYKLDGYGITNAYARVNFPVGESEGAFTMNFNNLFDVDYVQEGWDNAIANADGNYTHGRDNFKGFWGWGRNINFTLKLSF